MRVFLGLVLQVVREERKTEKIDRLLAALALAQPDLETTQVLQHLQQHKA